MKTRNLKYLIFLIATIWICGCGKKVEKQGESEYQSFVRKVDIRKCRELINNGSVENEYSKVVSNIVIQTRTNKYFNVSCNSDGEIVYRTLPESMSMNDIIDHGEFITDGKCAYGKFDSSDGELIYKLEGVDFKSFEVLGRSIYAKDKFSVYDTRHGKIENADLATFRPIWINKLGDTAYGRDKNSYFFWNDVIANEDTVLAKPKYIE